MTTIKKDLAAAGIAIEDEAGLVVDFHALCHTFITHLSRSGVHPSVAQTLARHSEINLTMSRYTHTSLESQQEAVAALPDFTVAVSKEVRATGTDDAAVNKNSEPFSEPFQGVESTLIDNQKVRGI